MKHKAVACTFTIHRDYWFPGYWTPVSLIPLLPHKPTPTWLKAGMHFSWIYSSDPASAHSSDKALMGWTDHSINSSWPMADRSGKKGQREVTRAIDTGRIPLWRQGLYMHGAVGSWIQYLRDYPYQWRGTSPVNFWTHNTIYSVYTPVCHVEDLSDPYTARTCSMLIGWNR